MGQVDGSIPQVNDPELEVALQRLLSVVGPLGKLGVLDTVIPIVSLGDVVTPEIDTRTPSYRSTDVFSQGVQSGAAANAIHVDTGPLPIGTYDLQVLISPNGTTAPNEMQLQHRNAANNGNVVTWSYLVGTSVGVWAHLLGYEIAVANERFIVRNIVALAAGDLSNAVIFARIRS